MAEILLADRKLWIPSQPCGLGKFGTPSVDDTHLHMQVMMQLVQMRRIRSAPPGTAILLTGPIRLEWEPVWGRIRHGRPNPPHLGHPAIVSSLSFKMVW
jgi:hypothetical protein